MYSWAIEDEEEEKEDINIQKDKGSGKRNWAIDSDFSNSFYRGFPYRFLFFFSSSKRQGEEGKRKR